MKLRYTLPARQDLAEIFSYINLHSQGGAVRVQFRIKAIAELLLLHPHIGIATEDNTIRRIATSPYPYLIFYEPTDDEIVIHSVRHSSRKPLDII
jgi:toxin ParE1/3/4